MNKTIAVLEGDGIGPEVIHATIKVLNAVEAVFQHTFRYRYYLIGAAAIDQTGEALPAATLEGCLQSDAVLFGAIGDPRFDNDPTAKVRPEQGLLALRKSLNLFANIRPVAAYPALLDLSPLKTERVRGVDMLIYRELTGGIYFGQKTLNANGTHASDDCSYSRDEIVRISHLAFKAAQQRRKKLTLVDKANVLETSRLWRKTVQDMAAQYPDVQLDCLFVDNAAMQLIVNPGQFDVILTENMFGDILSDEASVLTGSLGMLPSASIGSGHALFEPVHGSYPQAAGKNTANPIGSILSAAMLLDHFELLEEAAAVRQAVHIALREGILTEDLDRSRAASTSETADYIARCIRNTPARRGSTVNIALGQSTII